MLKQKTARVFISSTFRDMHTERDYLSKVIFPEVREILKPRGIYLVDVDLRWGITEQESEKGETLKICLDEIENSRPFFIGIIGDRYGWIPDEAPSKMLNSTENRFNWENKLKAGDHSVTALEIYYGVLNNLEQKDRSFFYFRDDKFIKDVPKEKVSDLKDKDKIQQKKLAVLKKTIKDEYSDLPRNLNDYSVKYKGLKINWLEIKNSAIQKNIDMDKLHKIADDGIVDNDEILDLNDTEKKLVFNNTFTYLDFDSLVKFGEQVKEDLLRSIYDEFPEDSIELDPLDQETMIHTNFCNDRSNFFVGREKQLQVISDYVIKNSSNKPLAIVGEPGSGKSALMAKAFSNCNSEEDNTLIIPHFVGCSPSSVDCFRTLNRFCALIIRKFNIELEEGIPDEYNKLMECFKSIVKQIPEKGKLIIFIDALNQLSSSHKSHSLNWLPEILSENVKIIISALPGEVLASIEDKKFPQEKVGALNNNNREEIIRGRLKPYRKDTLTKEQMAVILKKEESGKPLYLTIVAEELRLYGEYERVNQKIAGFSENIEGLFDQIFKRLEDDTDDINLVRDAMCLFECSRFGLLETEMLQLLKPSVKDAINMGLIDTDKESFELPRKKWSTLFLSISTYFRSPGEDKTGLIDFFHRQMSKAVRKKYLNKKLEKSYHKKLAEYFHYQAFGKDPKLSFSGYDGRGFAELPYHRLLSGNRKEAEKLLTDFTFLMGKARTGLATEILFDYEMLNDEY